MSFEGYCQCICPNGHYFEYDVYLRTPCDTCGKKEAWCNVVDQTNCNEAGVIPRELLAKHFGIGPDLFRVPTDEETTGLRHYETRHGRLVPIPVTRSE